jgi:hypothetical protein
MLLHIRSESVAAVLVAEARFPPWASLLPLLRTILRRPAAAQAPAADARRALASRRRLAACACGQSSGAGRSPVLLLFIVVIQALESMVANMFIVVIQALESNGGCKHGCCSLW